LREKVYFMSLKIMRSGGREVGWKREDMQCLSCELEGQVDGCEGTIAEGWWIQRRKNGKGKKDGKGYMNLIIASVLKRF
jgi:hypothetical protein